MNYLQAITVDEEEKWDKIVKSFKKYDVNYRISYAKAFQLHDEGEPLLLYYDDGDTRAINVVLKRDIAGVDIFKDILDTGTWYDLSSPYGYGGFLIEGDNYNAVNHAYDNYCNEQGFICEFVRFNLFSNYHNYYNGECETRTHNVVRTLELPIDEIMMDFDHKVRKNIKKAQKSGLEVKIDNTLERIDDFLDIYYATMRRTEANTDFFFPKSFFEMLGTMEDSYIYAYVLYEEKVISTELILYGMENCYSFLGGTDQKYFNLRPNDFLKYEIIKWAISKDLKRFILGGGHGDDDGIFKYKKSLAPNGVYDFYIGKKIFNEDKYNQLVAIREQEQGCNLDTGYFPKYRG